VLGKQAPGVKHNNFVGAKRPVTTTANGAKKEQAGVNGSGLKVTGKGASIASRYN